MSNYLEKLFGVSNIDRLLPVDPDDVKDTPEGKAALFTGFQAGRSKRLFGSPKNHGTYRSEMYEKNQSSENPVDTYRGAIDNLELQGFSRGENGSTSPFED